MIQIGLRTTQTLPTLKQCFYYITFSLYGIQFVSRDRPIPWELSQFLEFRLQLVPTWRMALCAFTDRFRSLSIEILYVGNAAKMRSYIALILGAPTPLVVLVPVWRLETFGSQFTNKPLALIVQGGLCAYPTFRYNYPVCITVSLYRYP